MMIFLAIALAFGLTSSEILTKYKRKPLKHIVNRYLLLYLLINGSLAAVVYHFLPSVASLLFSKEISQAVQSDSWPRVFIAGLGYALVLRSKLTDIKIGENEIPFGLDSIYQVWSTYFLRHAKIATRNKENQILHPICTTFQKVDTYVEALNVILNGINNDDERKSLSD